MNRRGTYNYHLADTPLSIIVGISGKTSITVTGRTVHFAQFAKIAAGYLTYCNRLYAQGIVQGFHVGYAADIADTMRHVKATARRKPFRLNQSAAATRETDQSGASQNSQRSADVLPP